MTEKQLRNKVISTAVSYIGTKQGTDKHKEIIDTYNAHKPLARSYPVKYTDQWCATFVSAVAILCGLTDIMPTECGCEQMIRLYQAHEKSVWQEDESVTPTPGDIIFYDWQDSGSGNATGWADHVGIVERVDGIMMTIIEGNYQKAVTRRYLQVNARYIRGYAIPAYKDKADIGDCSGYAQASCRKAIDAGVFQGDTDGNFHWKDPITRQDLCVILDRLNLL